MVFVVITFNLTMILLCLLGMGLGQLPAHSRLPRHELCRPDGRLISILYKVLVQMERSARMTIIGSLVLVIGALLVFDTLNLRS